jgi:hypothetical protein
MEKIMTVANPLHANTSSMMRKNAGGLTKLAIAVALGLGIGFYVAKTMSHEPVTSRESAAAVKPQDPVSMGDPREWVNMRSPAASGGTGSPAAGDGAGYLPSRIVNQAKKIEPLPPTF